MKLTNSALSSLSFILLAFLGLPSSALSDRLPSQISEQDGAQWRQYHSREDGFSVSLPARFDVSSTKSYVSTFGKQIPMRTYGAYYDGAVYVILAYDRPKNSPLKSFVEEFERRQKGYMARAELKFERDMVLDGFQGKQYSATRKSSDNSIYRGSVHFYATDKRAYILEAVSDDGGRDNVRRFTDSFRLTDKSITKDSVEILKTNESSATGEDGVVSPAQTLGKVFPPREVNSKAIVVSRPEPSYTEAGRENQTSGTVVLRAILSDSGEVVSIRTVSGLPHGLSENAIKVARQIKFLPATKDGKRVSQYIQIEYNFNLY